RVMMMENHDDAYYVWKGAGLKDRILVHLDAHFDLFWFYDKDPDRLLEATSRKEQETMLAETAGWNLSRRSKKNLVDIGNFIYPALKEGILKEFYWILPDQMVNGKRPLKQVREFFEEMTETNPMEITNVQQRGRSFTAEICGRRATACALSDVPHFSEPVLLDIDTDFLIIDRFSDHYPFADPGSANPWLWSWELVEQLKQKGVRTDFVTIPYSVEGGFTPLGYKYLGDDIASILRDPNNWEGRGTVMFLKREGTLHRLSGSDRQALMQYQAASDLAPEDPSIHYHLAHLWLALGDEEQARLHYQKARQLDPTYLTAYNNFGPAYEFLGQWEKAKAEYERILRLDPHDRHAYTGIGRIFISEQKWHEAIECFHKAVNLGEKNPDVHYYLGCAYAKLQKWDEALAQFQVLLSSKPLHVRGYFWLGHIYFETNRWEEAMQAYKTCLRLGFGPPLVHWRLGKLYLGKRMFYKAFRRHRDGVEQYLRLAILSFRNRLGIVGQQLWRRLGYETG
ncbi:MAG: tetratricopeptide repeat protein, partial [Candidatus Binatia bacterium]